jgi:hypothetical protein
MKKLYLQFMVISFIVFSFTQCKKDDGPSNSCNTSASFSKSISLGIVQFTNTSANFSLGDSIKWTFGDGASSYDANPIHTYSTSGRYNVCLWVKHVSNNCVSTVCDSILINTSNTNSGYTGTGSVTQGVATTTTNNLFPQGIRVAAVGTINSSNNQSWTVPADVNYNNTAFPFAPDLYNSYVAGHSYANASSAIAALNGNDIITIDNNGDVYTAYIFADNYFEMYINGQPVGKDAVPYTEFNSSIVRFKAVKPFTVAIKCVDWEEHLGVGTELNGTNSNYIGDGGVVVVIKNAANNIEDVTNNTWKAQTFYTSPISDLTCLSESGNYRYSTNCTTSSASTNSFGIHWPTPANWYSTAFDDSIWPNASTYSNTTVGVNNKPSYTNFTDIFDAPSNDASFIWSTNLLLDNLVLIRKTIQ